MSTIRGVKDRRFKFVQLLNSMFEDPKISLKSKGFIGFCLTKKEDWDFHISHLCSVLKEGECAIYSTIDECEKNGYAFRWQPHKENGEFASWETVISDSKEEIAKLKEELKDNPHFQKSFTLRGFTDAQSTRAQSLDSQSLPESPRENEAPIYSNTDLSNNEKQQQQKQAVAVSLEKKNPTNAFTPFIPRFSDIDIPDEDKEWIDENYSRATIENAVAWVKHPETKISKSLVAALKWACKNSMVPPTPKEEIAQKNKDFAKKYDQKESKFAKIEVLNNHLEITLKGCQKDPVCILYSDNCFKDLVDNTLQKYGFHL